MGPEQGKFESGLVGASPRSPRQGEGRGFASRRPLSAKCLLTAFGAGLRPAEGMEVQALAVGTSPMVPTHTVRDMDGAGRSMLGRRRSPFTLMVSRFVRKPGDTT